MPDGMKEQLAIQNLKIGSVLRFHCSVANKIKRFVVMGIKHDKSQVALVYINSEINEKVFPTSELKSQHIPISSNVRPYITNDSFVNCFELKKESYQFIFDLLKETPSIHIGEVSKEDYKSFRDTICDSRYIKPADKKAYGLFLK